MRFIEEEDDDDDRLWIIFSTRCAAVEVCGVYQLNTNQMK